MREKKWTARSTEHTKSILRECLLKNYYLRASLMFLFGNPIALFITTIVTMMIFAGFMIPDMIAFPLLFLSFIGLLIIIIYKFWTIALQVTIPVKASRIFLPIFSIYCFQICAAIIGVSEPRLNITYFLYFIPLGLIFFMREDLAHFAIPFAVNAMTVLLVLVLVVAFKRTKRKIIYDKIIIIYILVFACLASLSSHVSYSGGL